MNGGGIALKGRGVKPSLLVRVGRIGLSWSGAQSARQWELDKLWPGREMIDLIVQGLEAIWSARRSNGDFIGYSGGRR